MSIQTVARRLLERGLRGCVAVKKPKFIGSHKNKRLEWATNDWRKELWSDESTSELWKIREVFGYAGDRGKGF